MRSAVIITSLVAAATAQVDILNYGALARREVAEIYARASATVAGPGGESSKCLSDAVGLTESIPTPPPAIISEFEEHPQTDPCHVSIPASLSKDYSSYSKEVLSWYSAHKGELSSLAQDCSVLSSYTKAINVCTKGASNPAPTGGSSGSGGSGSGGSSASSPSGSAGAAAGSSKSGNAAPRETGMALAAVAAVGIAALL